MNESLEDFLGSEAFWKQIANFASECYTKHDRGAVLLHEQNAVQESANRANVAISYLPASDPSPVWNEENQSMAQDYDPANEFMVISIQKNGEALSMFMSREGRMR